MKLAVAQIRPIRGDIAQNIASHKKLIELAISEGAALIVFPELSLTAYERALGVALATTQDDPRLDDLQDLSNRGSITICAGLPTKSEHGVQISMILFQPNKSRITYSKQFLHDDETSFFVKGADPFKLRLGEINIAPAICYESLVPQHLTQALIGDLDVYLASVADSPQGVEKAHRIYPQIAREHGIIVMMSNCVGGADDFVGVGRSAIWNGVGQLIGQLDDVGEGLLILEMKTEKVSNFPC